MNSSLKKIASKYLLTNKGLLENYTVCIDSFTRIITDMYPYTEEPDVEYLNGILCPDFVNAHCHLELSHLKGMMTEGGGHALFAQEMAKYRDSVSPEDRLEAITREDKKMWESGTGYVVDIMNDEATLQVKNQSRIKYISFVEAFGLKRLNYRKDLTENSNIDTTPHSLYSLQDSDLEMIVKNNRSDLLSIHFLESIGEKELFATKGDMWNWYQNAGFNVDFIPKYKSPVERLLETIPQNKRVLLVHNCFATEEDIEMIDDHFENKPYWVLCPRSNHFILGTRPKIHLFLKKDNARILVGTDSLASNHSLSLLDEIRRFSDVPLEECLGWITYNGAKALQIADYGISKETRGGLVLINNIEYRENGPALSEDSYSCRII